MRMESPSELLFNRKIGRDGNPLFRSQTDLVQHITEVEKAEWHGKNVKSVLAFVNQVVNGERKLSPNLKHALKLVLPSRLPPGQDPEPVLKDIENAFTVLFQEKKALKKQFVSGHGLEINANDFYLLEKRGLTADNVFVTSIEPPLANNKHWAGELNMQMFAKLGVWELPGSVPGSYVFVFPVPGNPSHSTGFLFWQRLYHYLKDERGLAQPAKVLSRLNHGKQATLRAFHAPPLLCAFPIVVYDRNTAAEVGFTVFSYQDLGQEKISTARIAPSFLDWWKSVVYPKIFAEGKPAEGVEEVFFDDVLPDILKNEALA